MPDVLGPSTMAWREGGAGLTFSLLCSLKEISFWTGWLSLVWVLGTLLAVFLTLSTLDLVLSMVLALTGLGTSSP